MGPLIPQEIISVDLNFFFAFIIGVAFGFLLEQAGFTIPRKLVGAFYGYDFTVLKVLLTAAFTAALGIYFFQYLGWINMEYVYVSNLFVWPALAGGAIMGAGFLLGGFCPGTGFAAAATGKMDAMVFIAGMFAGVLLFGVYFDLFQPLYESFSLGRVFIYQVVGMSQGMFVVLMILAAGGVFYYFEKMERGSRRYTELRNYDRLDLTYPASLLAVLVILVIVLPGHRSSFWNEADREALAASMLDEAHYVGALRVAHSVMRDIDDLYLVDVRSTEAYERFHLPGAISIPLENLLDAGRAGMLQAGNRRTVFYSDGGSLAGQAWFLARRSGVEEVYILDGGLNRMFDLLFGTLTDREAEELGPDNLRFLEYARTYFRHGEIRRNIPGESRMPEIDLEHFAPIEGGC